jgi:hypothetical protein
MPINDKGVHDQIFVSVVVPLHNEVFEATQAVAVGGGEVSFRAEEVVVPIYRG